jgi:hypothetical protein
MPRPWAKLEQNYINHPKFLGLNANAICLWHEAKNYCDMQINDGLFPREALKTFRFHGQKALELLMRSCGQKPNGEPYAPLWEAVDIGGVAHIRMHDYLDHNDCRDKVLARMKAVDDERERDRQRKADARTAKKAKADARPVDVRPMSGEMSGRTSGGLPAEIRSSTEAASAPVSVVPSGQLPSARSKRPIYQSDRFAVFEWQLDELSRILGAHFEGFDLHGFFDDLSQRSRSDGVVIPGDRDARWKWLQAQVEAEAGRRGLPMASADAAPTNKRIDALMRGSQKALERMTLR